MRPTLSKLLNPQSQKELNVKKGLKGKKANKSDSGANYQDSDGSEESLAEPTTDTSSEARLTPTSSPSAEPSTDPLSDPSSQPEPEGIERKKGFKGKERR
jgi:hypothetical protein